MVSAAALFSKNCVQPRPHHETRRSTEVGKISKYGELESAFEAQLERTARFVPAAFHVHSPDSHDWGKEVALGPDDPSNLEGEESLDAYLDALVAAGLGLACVTDHMKADYAARLSARAASRDDITVLPGMEVSCLIPPGHAERVHLLVIFREGTSSDVIERIFAKQAELPGSAERTGEEVAKVDSLREWRELVEGQGGLLLLAHVDQHPRGHRAYVRRVRGETLEMFIDDGSDLEAQQTISNEYAEHLVEIAPASLAPTITTLPTSPTLVLSPI